jgi:Zn-dependent M28 family amino/carboxypeptidase
MKRRKTRNLAFLRSAALVVAMACRLLCKVSGADADEAAASITADDLMRHIRTLASDEFEGRAPGTQGEQLTVTYVTDQFKRIGTRPGNPDGTFVQKVPLAGITARDIHVSYRVDKKQTDLVFPSEAVVWTKRFVPEINVTDSDLVFVGYGVVAPEYGWDDYKGVDVRGKTLVMLINDPPVPDLKDPSKLDDKVFNGRAMTYYGRWTYKYEIASEKGAAAALIVHETGPAGYPWLVVESSNSRENFDLRSGDKNLSRVAVEGWMTLEKGKQLFTATGQDFDQLKKSAVGREFKPVPLGAKISFQFKNVLREVASQNVVARVEGSDPKLRNEYVLYTAHWDHLGRNTELKGDQIFNGARDNASGTAVLLELADAFAKIKAPPKRTVLFLSVTAEEKGLLGSKFYAEHPLYPLARTLAVFNTDSANVWGRTRDVNVIGFGQSTLEDTLRGAATARGRTLTPDAEPEKGRFYRSDHFEFAKVGVPGLYLQSGVEFIGQAEDFGRLKIDAYTANDYHKVSDEIKPDWDLSGAADDARLLFEVGLRVANGDKYPEWKPGSEFKARRELMLKKAGTQ